MKFSKKGCSKFILELSFAELDTLTHGVSIITDVIKSKVEALVTDENEKIEIIKSSVAYQLYTELVPIVMEEMKDES